MSVSQTKSAPAQFDKQTTDWAVYRIHGLRAVVVTLALLLLAGCSPSNARVTAPSVSADEVGRNALAEYDTNKDGFLDVKELDRCPALRGALKALDKNKDGK